LLFRNDSIPRILREVKDPVTKETHDAVTEEIGGMTIGSVRDKTSSGSYSGTPPR
jgi:hypothetical protein